MLKFLKYLYILAEIVEVMDKLQTGGSTSIRRIRGIKYRDREYSITFEVTCDKP